MKKALLFWFALVAVVFGQEKQEVKSSNFRMLPLGVRPTYKETVGCLTLEPPPYSMPPREVWTRNSEGNLVSVDLRLKELSRLVKVNGDTVELSTKVKKGAGLKSWTKLTLPKSGEYLAVLVKSPKVEKPDWKEVQTFMLDDDPKAFPAGTIRITNTSEEQIAARISKGPWSTKNQEKGKAFAINPGEIEIRSCPGKEAVVVVARKEKDGKWKIMRSIGLSLKEGERCNLVLYRGNGAKLEVWSNNEVPKIGQ